MEQIHIIALSLIAVILVLVIIFFRFFIRRSQKSSSEAQIEYIAGLNYLIDGQNEKALEHLRKSVRLDTELIDAYIKIGDILRSEGYAEKAIKVHRDLLVRRDLLHLKRTAILKSLARDYKANKDFHQAVTTCEQILELDRHDANSKDFLLSVYEEMKDWRNAFDLLKKNSTISKSKKASTLACYKVEEGLALTKLKKEHEARLCYREAIKFDKKCSAAFLELAHSYIREKRLKDALTALKQLVQNNPDNAELAFTRLKEVLFDLGQFGNLEKMYLELINSNPKVIEAHLGLAEMFEKKGEYLKAVDICKSAMEIDPHRLDIKLMLVRLKSTLGMNEDAVNIARKLAEEIVEDHHNYICEKCGFHDHVYFWHCPQCKAWNSTKRVKSAYH
jgi:lipopolysaccharide biosynthesis regulator YciM